MKIKTVFSEFNHNLFNALKDNSALRRKALADVKEPKIVMANRLIGYLNLSKATVVTLGGKLAVYLGSRHPEALTLDDMRERLSRCFNGDTSYIPLTYIRFINMAQIAVDLGMPIEQILYGTTNVSQIAEFNYSHYDDLDKIRRRYLSLQGYKHQTVAKYARYVHDNMGLKYRRRGKNSGYVHTYTYTKIAKAFKVSRQNLYNYLHGKNAILKKRTSVDAMSRVVGKKPVSTLTYPLMTNKSLQGMVEDYLLNYQRPNKLNKK